MFRQQDEAPELDARDVAVMEAIDQYFEGISFNKLATLVASNMSKVTLSRRIRKLKGMGLIIETTDPHHRQKKVFRSTSSMKELIGMLGQLDVWACSQAKRLSELESRLAQRHHDARNHMEIVETLTEILSEIGLAMVFVLQIRLRHGLKSAMLLVPKAIEAANNIVERIIDISNVYPQVAESISEVVSKHGISSELIQRISKRYLTTFEGGIYNLLDPSEQSKTA